MEKLILFTALIGSIGWIIDKVSSLKKDDGIKRRDEQIARLLEEIKLQKERSDEEISRLNEKLKQKSDKIIDLIARLKVQETLLAKEGGAADIQQVASTADEVDTEATGKAKACLLQSKRLALAAVEAKGREKERLLAQAEELAQKANEYRAVISRATAATVAGVQASAAIEKAKKWKGGKPVKAASPDFEVVA